MSEIPLITPYDQSGTLKRPSIVSLNYTKQDFWSMKSRLITFINERFGTNGTVLPNTFNDMVEGSVAIMLIENWAFLADTLSFKMDQIVNELFIDSVTEIENAFRLAKLVGFYPLPPIAARSMWIGTMNNAMTTDIEITTPVVVDLMSGDTPVSIELFQADINNEPIYDSPIIIPAGSTSNKNIVGLEGRTRTTNFSGTGEVAQTFTLPDPPVIFDSIRVTVDGVLWDRVDYFSDSNPRKEYRVEFDSSWIGYIIFGNNRAGMIPSTGSQIQVTHRTGGGIVGNIVTGFVETQVQTSVPGLAFNIAVNLRNYTRGEFGYNGDTLEDIRTKLPLWLRTQDRAVSGEDYKILCDQFATAYHGQIGKATAVLRNHGCSGNIVDLYILVKDGELGLAEADNDLKVALNEELVSKKMFTDFICIRDGVVVDVDVTVDIQLDKFYKKSESEFDANIRAKINNFFSLNNWDYGKTLKDTDLFKELSSIQEITDMGINFVTGSDSGALITTRFFEIIRPDVISLSFSYS